MKEKRVYIINLSDSEFEFRQAEQIGDHDSIKSEAERLGSVYSLDGFQDACNDEFIDLGNSFILID